MKYKLNGQWYEIAVPSYDATPVGTIIPYAGSTAPEGYLMCDGSNVSRTTYGELFNVIGTTYGQGDTSTTFGLPNIKGKVLVMLDTSQTEFNTLGKNGGEKTHYHNLSNNGWTDIQIRSGGVIQYNEKNLGSNTWTANYQLYGSSAEDTSATGNYGAVLEGRTEYGSSLQPYIVVNYIIKAHPSAVNTSEVVNEHSTSETDVYSCNYVNGIIESGSNTNGKYIKYIDGTMICTKEISTTIGNWESWGNLFEGYISGGNFPQEFIETPIMNITNIGTGGAMVESVESISKSNFGKIYFARPTTQTSTNVKVDIIAIGRWK